MSRRSILLWVAALLCVGNAGAAELNAYEWSAVAPVVVLAENLGIHGKTHEILVDFVLRGEVEVGSVLHLNLRRTNRLRNLNADPKPLKVDIGVTYVWLLELDMRYTRPGKPVYELVRGVRGAREVPAEGQEAYLLSMRKFIAIQNMKSDNLIWASFSAMLESISPMELTTALQQFQKFRRGDPELLLSIRPLLDHPDPGIRADTARLVGQILGRHLGRPIPEEETLVSELVSAARRDGSVDVRVAATEALDAIPQPTIVEILEEIARDDPEQLVRYTAQKMLLGRRKAAESQDDY